MSCRAHWNSMIRWRFFSLKTFYKGLFSLLWDEFQQDRKCVKNHSHLLQGPMKTECISKMRNCSPPGHTLLSHCRRFGKAGSSGKESSSESEQPAHSHSNVSDQMICLLLPQVWLPTLFCSSRDLGRSQWLCKAGDAMWYAREWEKKETFGLQATELT